VLTGGSAKMEGVIELAEEIFHMPVRLGMPQTCAGLADVVRNPIYATGVGCCCTARRCTQPRAGGRKATAKSRMIDRGCAKASG
jgi:cell division protein FtsA